MASIDDVCGSADVLDGERERLRMAPWALQPGGVGLGLERVDKKEQVDSVYLTLPFQAAHVSLLCPHVS